MPPVVLGGLQPFLYILLLSIFFGKNFFPILIDERIEAQRVMQLTQMDTTIK